MSPDFLRNYATSLAVVLMTGVLIFIYVQQEEQTQRLEDLSEFNVCQSLEQRVEVQEAQRSAFFAQRERLRSDLEEVTPPLTFRTIDEALGRIKAPPPPDAELVQRRDEVCQLQ
jgi:hypothetical protein